MSHSVISGSRVYFGGYDLSGDVNQATATLRAEALDDTCMGDDTRTRLAGLQDVSLSWSGFYEPATNDLPAFDGVGTLPILTLLPQGIVAESVAYTWQGLAVEYGPTNGAVGDLASFAATAEGSAVDTIRGSVVQALATVTGSGNGTAYELGAVGAAEQVIGVLHVMAVTGTDVVVTVESDDNEDFTSATTRLTFSTATGVTAEIKTASGAITDTWWRITYAVTGTSASIFVSLAIQ